MGSIFEFPQDCPSYPRQIAVSDPARMETAYGGQNEWTAQTIQTKLMVPANGNPLSHAIRIFIPHHTTASAITRQVAVKAFSKADEAIAMLSFAYPNETSMRFRRGTATSRS
jgi:hypothetical protein